VKIPKERLDDKPIETRGTPPYMAPELFTSEGVHSFQSDFWAVGCLFYELRKGQPPFGGPTMALDRLMNNIRSVEPIHAPLSMQSSPVKEKNSSRSNQTSNSNNNNNMPSFSVELADLLLWLLEKAPMNRCVWLVSSFASFSLLMFCLLIISFFFLFFFFFSSCSQERPRHSSFLETLQIRSSGGSAAAAGFRQTHSRIREIAIRTTAIGFQHGIQYLRG
jgi:serine/threonine protein kinase